MAGIGAVVQHADWALQAVRWFGVAFLTWYGLSSAWRARRPSALAAPPDGNGGGAAASASPSTLRRMLALTWLNPHVYLDTWSCSARSRTPAARSTGGGSRSGRWSPAPCWFVGLGFGARFAAPLLTTPRAWQVLDLLIAATMLAIAAKLAF